MIHTFILFGCLAFGWALAAVVLHLTPRFPRWGDRRAMHQLAIFSPLLALGLAGTWSVDMVLDGCLNFTTQDGIGTIALVGTFGVALMAAAVRATWQGVHVRHRMTSLATKAPSDRLNETVARLAVALRVATPRVVVLHTKLPIACVVGVWRPTLFMSRGLLAALPPEEADAVIAHELAHLRHMDNLLAWLDVILLRAFSFIPPIQRAWRESLAEREEAADALAANATGAPLALASALVSVLELEKACGSAKPELPALAVSTLTGAAGSVERRVDRLLAPAGVSTRPWGAPAVAAAACAAALPFLTAWVLGFATSCLHHA